MKFGHSGAYRTIIVRRRTFRIFLGFCDCTTVDRDDGYRAELAGSSSALMNAAGAVAGILSPVAFGWFLDRTGSWTTPFGFSVGLLLFAIIMTWRIRPDHPIETVGGYTSPQSSSLRISRRRSRSLSSSKPGSRRSMVI
jgi:MFS family permease